MFWMLNGPNPAGIPGSANPPATAVGAKFPSNTSIFPDAKLAANRSGVPVPTDASPLYTAPAAELSTILIAVAGAAIDPFHAEIVPSSVAKMNDETLPFGAGRIQFTPFPATCPVGVPIVELLAVPGGIFTTTAVMAPAPLYSVDSPVS